MSRVISYSTSPSSVPGNGSSEEGNVRTYRMPMACSTFRDAVFTEHRLRDHPVLPDGGEGVPEQGAGRLAGQALPPVPADQAVTQV